MSSTHVVLPEDTVPCRVQYKQRRYTDIAWGIINLLAYITYVATGLFVVSKSQPRHKTLADGSRGLSDYFMADAATCCANTGFNGYVCSIYQETLNNGGRRLAAGSSKFDGDEGIFDAFIEAPGIIVGILSVVLGVSILWVVLLRFFSKPIVVIVELAKIALMIVAGVYQQETSTKVICFIFATLMVAYVVWQWKTIMFAAKMIKHSTISLKENPSILVGSLFAKILYAGNAALFVLFFAESFDAVQVQEYDNSSLGFSNTCDFAYLGYVQNLSIFWCFAYLWTVLFFDQMRLSIIATIVGSWHFHPEDKPSVFKAIGNILPSFGTLSVSSLIATIADKVNRMMSEDAWRSWVSPTICITWPLQCFMCVFGSCIYGVVKMLTGYAVILHTFTGESFIGSARNSFKILSRHFKGGFVTEYTSRSLFSLASYVFSLGVAVIAWVWIDTEFKAGSLPQNSTDYLWILWLIIIIFNAYYPVLGIYILIIANKYIREWERAKMTAMMNGNGTDDWNQQFNQPTNHIWIPPLAGAFVGCIAMMFFTFLSNMFVDIISTLFLCFAIDKDNNIGGENVNGQEFESLVKEMPNYIDNPTMLDDPEQANNEQVAVAFPVKVYSDA